MEKSSAPSYVFATEDTSSGEYYGFALFIFATVAFFLWILWALTPDSILQKIGIDWYPNRYVSQQNVDTIISKEKH